MRKFLTICLAMMLLLVFAFPAPASAAIRSAKYPTISIVSVEEDASVTVRGKNFPSGDRFDVLMGKIGTRGVKGIKVDSLKISAGGAFTATFTIPSKLKGLSQIAIRLQSSTGSGYYAYNWFYNNTSGTTPTPDDGYTGYPTFSIVSVVAGSSVTIRARNLPPNDEFDVLMGKMGTRGVNGTYVTTFETGTGGAKTFTFNIPSGLKGKYQIAIRMESTTGSGYFAYNWFYNNTTR